MDKIKAMRSFVKIIECGNLTTAANTQGVSLPTMVRTLAGLEASLGVKLINRTTRKISLTEEGTFYLERCQKILADIDDTETSLMQNRDVPTGKITISASSAFGEMHMMPLIKEYLKLYPDMSIELILDNKIINLFDNTIDFTIRIGHLKDSSLVARKVGIIREIVVASPDFIHQNPSIKTPEDLTHLPCLRYISDAVISQWIFKKGEQLYKVPVTGGFATNNIKSNIDACCSGLGVGRFLNYQVTPLIERGELEILLDDFKQPEMPISIVYPCAKLIPYRTKHAIEWFCNSLKQSTALTTEH